MLCNQCFTVTNSVLKSQARSLSRVRCLSREQQKTFNKICYFRNNTEAVRWITTTVQCKPAELIKKGDNLFKNVHIGSYFISNRDIHISPTSYQKSNQDNEKRKNYIFIGFICLWVGIYIILSFTIEEHADYVKVK